MSAWDEERYRRLRSAVYRGDGEEAVELLRGSLADAPLQLAGDGLLIGLREGVADARDLAEACVDELRSRGWVGDWDLADELDAELGRVPEPDLRPIPVDLEEVAAHLEGGPIDPGVRLEVTTGEVWPDTDDLEALVGVETPDDWDDPDAWLHIWPEGSSEGYRDMVAFAGTVEDERLVELLDVALDGKGAFRRFRDVLSRYPDERERWYAFSDDRTRGRARAWLAVEGYRPATPAWGSDTS